MGGGASLGYHGEALGRGELQRKIRTSVRGMLHLRFLLTVTSCLSEQNWKEMLVVVRHLPLHKITKEEGVLVKLGSD